MARAGRATARRCRRAARDFRRRAGAAGRGRHDARAVAGRRALLDALWRDRMPAGGGDRGPRTARPRAATPSAAPAPASAGRSRRTRCASSRIDDAAIAEWSRRAASLRRAWSARSPSPGPMVTDSYFNRDAARALAKIRERCPTAASASCIAWATSAISMRRAGCGSAGASRSAWTRARAAVHRAGRADLQHAPRGAAHRAGRRRRSGASNARCCASNCSRRAAQCDRPRIARRAARNWAAGTRIPAASRASCCHPGFPVDIRHNAKIGREKLSAWAARKLGVGE